MILVDNASPVVRVTLNDLSRLPVERLARLLLERAAEDPMLLSGCTRRSRKALPGSPASPL